MKLHLLSEHNSILNHFLSQLRDVEVQKDSMRFRRNLERIGEIMAYEISKVFIYEPAAVTTPLGTKNTAVIKDEVVVCSILRAGLALHNGFMNFYDAAGHGFISARRFHPNNDHYFEIKVEYQAAPHLTGKNLIIVDPMLATGLSMSAVFKQLLKDESPASLHIAVVIATPEGVQHLQKELPDNCHLWIASLDEGLNESDYIIPGLGDAGDLAYGLKL